MRTNSWKRSLAALLLAAIEGHKNRKVPEEFILPEPVGARGFEPPTPRPPV